MSEQQGERILTPIIDLIKASPNEDRQEQFERLWGILGKMHEKICQRFDLQLDPVCEDLVDYQWTTATKARPRCTRDQR